jgi:hypothetical protein
MLGWWHGGQWWRVSIPNYLLWIVTDNVFSGGYGTNGANGGNAGSVFITVNEDDLDLLLPMFWDIRGGKGGQSGSHGNPGDGGIGGDGGSGGTW